MPATASPQTLFDKLRQDTSSVLDLDVDCHEREFDYWKSAKTGDLIGDDPQPADGSYAVAEVGINVVNALDGFQS